MIGSDLVQRHSLAPAALHAGISFGLMVASVLYINQFPDARADAASGKRTLVVRLGPQRATLGYAVLVLGAAVTLLLGVLSGALHAKTLFASPGLLPAVAAYRHLRQHCAEPSRLLPAIKHTLLAAHAFGILLAIMLVMD